MRILFSHILGLVIASGFCTLVAAADSAPEPEEDSVRVFRDLQPSVVSLQNAEGSGTGIIIDASGLILTNTHVVISPLPYKCMVDVVDASGQSKQVEFKRVQVVGYHPSLDLALVRVDPKEAGVKLKAATIADAKPSPGQHVFVIGNPAGGGMVLTKTITAGMLSAVDRIVEGEPYYQIDAAINPGNSGGPLADRKGHVLGVITFKFNDVQAIGFAIPIQNLKTADFLPLSQKKGNPERSKELIALGSKFLTMAHEAGMSHTARVRQPGFGGSRLLREPGDEKARLIDTALAVMCFRQALSYDPSNSAAWYSVADALGGLKEYEPAAAYMLRYIQMNPWGSSGGNAYRELGMSQNNLKRPDDAIAAYEEGIAKFPFNGRIWFDLALAENGKNDAAGAAYDAGVALIAGSTSIITNKATNLRSKLIKSLPEDSRKDVEARDASDVVRKKLEKMLADSNNARKAHEVYLTKEFAKYAMDNDGPVPAGVKEQIPQDMQTAPPIAATPPAPIAASGGESPAGNEGPSPKVNAQAASGNAVLDALRDGHFTKPHPSASPTTYLKAVSSPGDSIGQGKTFDYQGATVRVRGATSLLTATVDGWFIQFAPARGKSLGVGEYPDARRFPFNQDSPGIDFHGHAHMANSSADGKFVIWELEIQDNRITRLAVDFVYHSATGGPPLYGILRYNSTFE